MYALINCVPQYYNSLKFIINFTACNSFSKRKTSFCKYKHISGSIIVRLETCEIPTAKLIKINDTIFVKIKIFKGFFKLIAIERMTEIRRKLLKLTLINSTTRIFVKLAEGWFYIFFIFLIVFFNHSFQWWSKTFSCFTSVFEINNNYRKSWFFSFFLINCFFFFLKKPKQNYFFDMLLSPKNN